MIGWLQPRAQRYRFLPERRLGDGALPWVIGIMAFLASLALAGGIALAAASASLAGSVERGFTIQLVEPNADIRATQTRAVVRMLAARRDVTNVRIVGPDEMRALLEPWLGAGNVGEELPLPVMIDGAFVPDAPVDPAVIARAAGRIAPGARLDTHAQWFAPLAGVVDLLTWLALAIGVLVAVATAAIVTLSVRSAISSYAPTIETLHMIGAEDRTVAALFEYRYALSGLLGGAGGVVAATLVIVAMDGLLGEFGGGTIAELHLPLLGWAALVLIPVAMMVLALAAARRTVGRALRAQL
jgi:cell division transport system permease protein